MIVDADAHPGFTTNLPWHLAVPLVALMGERKAETPPPRVPHGSLIPAIACVSLPPAGVS